MNANFLNRNNTFVSKSWHYQLKEWDHRIYTYFNTWKFYGIVNSKTWPFLIQEEQISIMLTLSPGLRRESTKIHISFRDWGIKMPDL